VPTINRLSGVHISGAATASRIVAVPDSAYKLLKRTGLKPPENVGEFLDNDEVDAALRDGDLNIGERVHVKIALRDAGLLPGGRAVSSVKR
jgi:hypothetical protein